MLEGDPPPTRPLSGVPPMTTRKALPAALLGAALATAAIGWLTAGPRNTQARPEVGPAPRPAPLFAQTEPAKNPTALHLQDDGHKVVGWVSGPHDYKGRP